MAITRKELSPTEMMLRQFVKACRVHIDKTLLLRRVHRSERWGPDYFMLTVDPDGRHKLHAALIYGGDGLGLNLFKHRCRTKCHRFDFADPDWSITLADLMGKHFNCYFCPFWLRK